MFHFVKLHTYRFGLVYFIYAVHTIALLDILVLFEIGMKKVRASTVFAGYCALVLAHFVFVLRPVCQWVRLCYEKFQRVFVFFFSNVSHIFQFSNTFR